MILSAFLKVNRTIMEVQLIMDKADGIPYCQMPYRIEGGIKTYAHKDCVVIHGGHLFEKVKNDRQRTCGKVYAQNFEDISPDDISEAKAKLYSLWEKQINELKNSGAEVQMCFGKVDF